MFNITSALTWMLTSGIVRVILDYDSDFIQKTKANFGFYSQ